MSYLPALTLLAIGAAAAPVSAQTAAPAMPMDHGAHHDHDMSSMPMDEGSDQAEAMPGMPGMAVKAQAQEGSASGTDQAPGKAPAPVVQPGLLSDRTYGADRMGKAHEAMVLGHGAGTYYQVMFNIAEYQVRKGHDGYRWDAEAWLGDLDRLVLKSQGEGSFHDKVDAAELQALYSKALDPWWNLQLGVRHDFQPTPSRTYATVGIEGLAPYLFHLNGALFLSDQGDLLGRIEGTYDERITQRLILQPRLELNLAAQDVPENGIGSGLSDAELGLRLRYEFSPKFAPYVGVSWTWKAGRTADYARAAGQDVNDANIVFGLRTWF